MKKLLVFLVVSVVGAALAPAPAQSPGYPANGSTLQGNDGGLSVKHLAPRPQIVETHVNMPSPPDPEPGPTAFGSELMPSRGSAIVRGKGGAIGSPRQRADREIRQLIRKLN